MQEIKKLANFLEVQCTDEFLSEVADNCSFNYMKKSQEEMSNEIDEGEIANDKGAHEKLISSDSVYRKGTLYNFIDRLPLQTIWYILLIQSDFRIMCLSSRIII